MSAEFIHALSDESPDFRKEIGCINRVLQLFERHRFLGDHRQISCQNHKRLTSGQNGNRNDNVEPNIASRRTTDKGTAKDKQGISAESSTTSFSSSSCSSSLSSFECSNRDSQMESCLFSQTTVSETNDRDLPLTASFRSNQQSPDLRDVVRDSIYRQARKISVKTATEGESGSHILKYVDSPRPGKDSSQFLPKLQETPRKSHDGRRTSMASAMQGAPRFSCDGRESTDTSKSTVKPKEQPRLSLDSRAGQQLSGSSTEMKSNYLLADLEGRNTNSDCFLTQPEEPESRTRLSNVVAKLMGLEVLPDFMSINVNQIRHIRTHSGVKNHCFHGSSKTTEKRRQNRTSVSSIHLQRKETISPRLRNGDSVKKPIPNSKVPTEPAPWRHLDGSISPRPPPLERRITHCKSPNISHSVYGKIQKGKGQVNFRQPGKDHSALKQTLETMQRIKGNLETDIRAPRSETHANNGNLQKTKSSNLYDSQSDSIIPDVSRGSSQKSFKSSIVIMKPAKFMQKGSNPASTSPKLSSILHGAATADFLISRKESIEKQTVEDLTPRTNHLRKRNSLPCPTDKRTAARFERLLPAWKESQSTPRESTSSGKILGTLKQRQRNFDMHKQTTTPNSRKTRTHSRRQPTESNSPRRKPKSKPSDFKSGDDELSDPDSDVRDMSCHRDGILQQSESTISMASQIDEEVSSFDRSHAITDQKQKKQVARSGKDVLASEPAVVCEQPSPVSVLDAVFCGDELPSPLKKKSVAFQEDNDAWIQVDVDHSSSHTDQQSILGIRLASDLVNNFEYGFKTNHPRRTGCATNLELFLDLEQPRESSIFSNNKWSGTKIFNSDLQIKHQRKLASDVMNEILIHKFLQGNYSKLLADERRRWEELRSEFDRLLDNVTKCQLDGEQGGLIRILRADLTHQTKHWKSYNNENRDLVLDIERLIFKDLISEVITG